jgi:hypothetical protein
MKTIPSAGLSGALPDAVTTPLILDLLDWLAVRPRPYDEVMDVWRTSCPRLTIWEDAVDRGLVVRRRDGAAGTPVVDLTQAGRRIREARGQAA